MKILMVLEGDFPPDLRVENEISSLIAANHKVILACYTFGNNAIVEWNGCKIEKRSISKFIHKSSVGALKFPLYFNFWRKHLTDIIRKENPDVIHIHDLPLARVGFEMKLKYGMKFTLDLHENWPALLELSSHTKSIAGGLLSSSKQWKRYEIESCQKADQVIVVIEEAKERLKKIGITADKIEVVANYSNLTDFDNLPATLNNPDQYTLFYAGGISEHRGLQFVIKAMPEVLKICKNAKLQILGDGRFRNVLEDTANKLGVSDHIEFTGKVPYKRVLEELGRADIALIPHIKSAHTDNTIPHKLFQYMYCGKKIIASNCDPIERIINDSKAGYIYQWNSPDDFTRAFSIAYRDTNYDAHAVKELVIKKYNWISEQQKIQKIYMH